MASNSYEPYVSESDTDSGSGSDSELSTGTPDSSSLTQTGSSATPPRNFAAFAQKLSMIRAGGPNITSREQELASDVLPSGFAITNGYPTFKDYEIPKDPSGAELKFTSQSVNSVIMLDSTNRDMNVFPQPTSLTLRLPRVYSNITNFQLVQIKLLSSFLYFSLAKNNTDITILEKDRTTTDIYGNIVPYPIKVYIEEGTWDIDSLVTQLSQKLNRTPLFYDFPNGLQDFAPKFAATGDYSIGFNYPGDNYYDSLTKQYITKPSIAFIVGKYFQSQYAGLSVYNTSQIKVAYYYPVLKEALLDPNATPFLNLTLVTSAAYLLPGETPYSRCIYTFQGINDQVVTELILLNNSFLDQYRLLNTFRYSLVNEYSVTYSAQSFIVTISSSGLNTSLATLITQKQTQLFAEQLNAYNISQELYTAYNTLNTLLLAVVNDMFAYLQEWLAIHFGINFATYSIDYITNPAFLLPLRDAFQAANISTKFDLNVISTNKPLVTNNVTDPFLAPPNIYWPRLKGLPENTLAYPFNLEGANPNINLNSPYNILTGKQDPYYSFVGDDGVIHINKRTKSADLLVPIEASKYTVLRFKSPVRQTLQIETLPRPTQYRYGNYNAITYDISSQILFDKQYGFVENQQNENIDVLSVNILNVPGYYSPQSDINFGLSYTESLAIWGTNYNRVQLGDTVQYFQMSTPYPSQYTQDPADAYRYNLSITLASVEGNFVAPMNLYIYHDRAAFMADISGNRQEKAIHYIAGVTGDLSVSNISVSIPVYANEIYYFIVRSSSTVTPTQQYRLVPWFPDGQGYTPMTTTLDGFDPLLDPTSSTAANNLNYAYNADPAYIRLPIQPAIQTTPVADPLFSTLTFSTVAIGYDISGVSTDLTDYCGYKGGDGASNFIPNSAIRVDPVSGYVFQVGSGYDPSSQTYLTSTNNAAIVQPYGAGLYTPSTVQQRETTLVHWYGQTYLPNSQNQPPIDPTVTAPAAYIQPYTQTTTDQPIQGYSYGGTGGAVQLGNGVISFSLLPKQGVWDISRLMFKSIFNTGSALTDPNLAIKYLAIFPSAYVSTTPVNGISMSRATVTLSFSSYKAYTPADQNFDFDPMGGTYYEFTRSYSANSTMYLYGYSQNAGTITTDTNNLYSVVPFDVNGNVLTYQGLVGSPVAYPYYSNAVAATKYLDGTSTISGKSLVIPVVKANPDIVRVPPAGYDQTQSQYEQSMPIGTNLLQYIEPYSFIGDPAAMKAWTPFATTPTKVVTDVAGYILTTDGANFTTYTYDTLTTVLSRAAQFTPAVVPNLTYIDVAANETNYALFYYSTVTSPDKNYLFIQERSPVDGSIVYTYSTMNIPEFNPLTQTVRNVTYNNYRGFTMSISSAVSTFAISKHTSSTTNMTVLKATIGPGNLSLSHFITLQSPKEQYGNFYAASYRTGLTGAVTAGTVDYVQITPSNVIPVSNPSYLFTSVTGKQESWSTAISTCAISVYNLVTAAQPRVFRDLTVTRQPYVDVLTMRSDFTPTRLYQVTGYAARTVTTATSNVVFTSSIYVFPSTPTNLTAGANGGTWSLVGNTLYGNRNNAADAPITVTDAWQIFYPLHRAVFTQVAKNFTYMDRLDGLTYPEYPHVATIVYDSLDSLTADTQGKWGAENSSNFMLGDFRFRGPTFNSKIFTVPLEASTSAKPYYYVALRNYSPTETSQVLLRCSLPNRYDFGYTSLTDLASEINASYTSTSSFDPEYLKRIQAFNSSFVFGPAGKIFGANLVQGYAGSNIMNVNSFQDFYTQFCTLYKNYLTQVTTVQAINANTQSNLNNFIRTELSNILPASALSRQRSTDPLTFSILWKSALQPPRTTMISGWGLGWNLGFVKQDTSYETTHRSDTLFKIVDDFINIKLNAEFDMNRIDTGAQENLSQTLEPTGYTKAFHGKLLLANFGSYAQTLVSNPISFNPPLGRLDKLTVTLVDAAGVTLNNVNCDWNAVVQIVEKKDVMDVVPMPRVVLPLGDKERNAIKKAAADKVVADKAAADKAAAEKASPPASPKSTT